MTTWSRNRTISSATTGRLAMLAFALTLFGAGASLGAQVTQDAAEAAVTAARAGLALQNAKRYAEAEAKFREATTLDPTRADHRARVGSALIDQSKYADAIPEYLAAIGID